MSRIINRRKDANEWHLQNPAATLLSLPLALSLRKERMFMYGLLVPTPYKKGFCQVGCMITTPGGGPM